MGSLFGRGFDSLQLHEVEMNPERNFRGFVLIQNNNSGHAAMNFKGENIPIKVIDGYFSFAFSISTS